MSMTTVSLSAPSATPFSPNKAALTFGEFGTMVMTTSTPFATSALFAPAVAPAATSSSTASLWKSFTQT